MHIVGHGVDIVSVARIDGMVREHAERFLERCFTPGELAYCTPRKNAAQHLAARFAAKEAVLKALGSGLSDGITWTEVEVARSATGAPSIVLTGRAAERAGRLNITGWFVSLSHTDSDAIASVVAVGG